MINAELKDGKATLSASGSEAEIIAESMVLLKAICNGLNDAGSKHAKSSMRLAIIYSLLSGNLFDEEPASELLESFFETVGMDKDKANAILAMEKDDDGDANMEILEKEDALRKAIEKAAAYGD